MPYTKNIIVYINMENTKDKSLVEALTEISKHTDTPVSTIVKNILHNYLNTIKPQNKKYAQENLKAREDLKVEEPVEKPLLEDSNERISKEDSIGDTILGLGFKD